MQWQGGRTGGQYIDDRRPLGPTGMSLGDAWNDTMGDFQRFGSVAAERAGRAIGLLPPLQPGVTGRPFFPDSHAQNGLLSGLQSYIRRQP